MKRFRYLFGRPGEQGSITPIVALGLMAFIGFLALGIDLGQLYVVKNDLQNAADGAALAAAQRLIQDQNGDGIAEVHCDQAITAAINFAKKNYSLGASGSLTITAADVTMGKWNLSTKSFDSVGCSANPMEVNAVQVRVRRNGGDNPQVQTYLGKVLGAGAKQDAEALATAYLGLAGTSAVDPPLAAPPEWANGDPPLASNGMQRILDKIAPAAAYAGSGTRSYRWYDKGGSNLPENRATLALSQKDKDEGKISANRLWEYLDGTKQFPQIRIGEKLYPISEYYYGWWNLQNFKRLKDRWNAKKNSSGKWRATVPVFKRTQVTSLPQNSWLKMAARLLPGVPQAYACTAYSVPAVFNQGFITLDITDVHVNEDCVQTNGSTQINDEDSCRNTNYMDIEVPLDKSTVSKDRGSNPIPFQKDYKDMNSSASEVGVFAAVPRIVK